MFTRFKYEESDTEGLSDLLIVTQLINSKANVLLRVLCTHGLCLATLCYAGKLFLVLSRMEDD